MTKRVGLLSAWLIATLALGFVGYAAVALVGDQVTDQPTGRVVNLSVTTTILDRDFVPGSIAEEDADPEAGPPTFGTFDESDFDPDLTPTIPPSDTSDGATSTTDGVAPSTAPPATEPPPPSSGTQPPPPPTTTVPPTSPTTVPDDDDPSDDGPVETGPFSFTSAGGVVTVTCIEDRVRFGGASPSGGASVSVMDRGPMEVKVRFATNGDLWITTVTCDDGMASAEFE